MFVLPNLSPELQAQKRKYSDTGASHDFGDGAYLLHISLEYVSIDVDIVLSVSVTRISASLNLGKELVKSLCSACALVNLSADGRHN